MRKLTVTLLVSLMSLIAAAQNSVVKELRFYNLNVQSGFLSYNVSDLCQDKEAYMWLATNNGLVRYNGYEYRMYNFGWENEPVFVNTVYEDRKGTIWAGTAFKGLYYYNRANDTFLLYRTSLKDSVAFAQNTVNRIQDDNDGDLWLLLSDYKTNEIACLNTRNKTSRYFSYKEPGQNHILAKHVYDMQQSRDGRFWFTSDEGLYEYKKTSNTLTLHFHMADSLQQTSITHICEDAHQANVLWFSSTHKKNGRPLGLWRWDTKQFSLTHFYHDKNDTASLANDTIQYMGNSSGGTLWMATNSGLSEITDGNHIVNYRPGKEKGKVSDVIHHWVEDRQKNMWCLADYGLFYFNSAIKKFSFYGSEYKNEETLRSIIRRLFIDKTNTLWACTEINGVPVQYINEKRSKFRWYHEDLNLNAHKLKGDAIFDFSEADDGTMWLASSNGLYHWFPQRDSFVRVTSSLYHNLETYVGAVRVDGHGLVWYYVYIFKTGDEGVNCYDTKTGKTVFYRHNSKDSTSLSANTAYTIFVDRRDNVWIGTFGGAICRFDRSTHTFIRYPYPPYTIQKRFNINNTDVDKTRFIFEDSRDSLWIAGNSLSLATLNSRTGFFTIYDKLSSVYPDKNFISEDREHRIWTGSLFTGAVCFDRNENTLKTYTVKNGLLTNDVIGILEDNRGNMWFSCIKGISILNPATGSIRTLLTGTILPDQAKYSFCMRNGTFLFAGQKGFIALNPDDYAPDENPPVVHIETVSFTNPSAPVNEQKDSSLIRWGKQAIKLSYSDNKVTFTYVGIHYQDAVSTVYAYRLDNYDKRWIEAGTDRSATYANLSPGTYTFHIKAANGDGVWSKMEDSITIVIATPWWQTWWFYTLMALTAFGLIYLVYRYQLEQALKVERVRNRIASDLHDEIGSTLSAITLFSEMAQRQSETAVASPQLLQRINETSRKVTQAMRDIVWSINTKNDSFDKMITHMHEHALELLELKGYELHFAADEKLHSINLSMEKRQNLYLIYKEALNNIIKYAGGKNVWIHICKEKQHLILSLKDDGIGFDSHYIHNGNGLQSMKSRAAAIHGSIIILSAPGGGCEVVCKVPV